ncbi:hypothetical protein FAM23877_00210 [Propionibacterium freudenreichii]|uniref:hypothetical protein n=1 Tax=Propionibacterium freudenreichii TaxID=1744 RepID=UPI000BC31032|nr:hypothetical protein [Propionibacterium freudenreichii]MDK9294248.1 hypothetical protein [Propionibacterium freudenreichii]MDK9359703.1 hypothetical protein [Propionibacterium freudenreichii]MDK9638852.1 hypothetical protein [Propionibacterium freudenreichii]MDK9659424.1 hypothetical protein [Propionibacterium freudenreichii]WGU90431.1 hypothetical protein FAM23877_00210 [Propionibacterium freudenreichii]
MNKQTSWQRLVIIAAACIVVFGFGWFATDVQSAIVLAIGTGAALGAVSHFWPKKKVVVTADGRTVKTCDDGGACCCH